MHFNILTVLPDAFKDYLNLGVIGRALKNKIWSYDLVNIRDFAFDNYKSVDDVQFGGGKGLVFKPDVLGRTIDSVKNKGLIIYFSPKGKLLNQKLVHNIIDEHKNITLICGRYEGIDERVIEEYSILEISIGDYILSGGELPAQVFIDSCVRLLNNVIGGGQVATTNESFEIGGLEWPLYTRPSVWRGRSVPEVLLSGHHKNIERWRKEMSQVITKKRRPDLLKEYNNEYNKKN